MSDRRYRWLLWLFPASFREDHQKEILRVWREERRDTVNDGRVWRTALKDTLRAAPREYVAAIVQNLAIALRTLRQAPAFAITAVLTLGLGTGATAAVFSLVNGIILRPLPWQNPGAVGLVWAIQPSRERTWLSFPELDDIQRQITSFSSVAAFSDIRFAYIGKTEVTEVQSLAVSHEFFRVLGVPPARGRDFTPEEDHRNSSRTVVLSHGFWQSHLGADPSIVGQSIRLNDHQYTVIGIAPEVFEWLPPSTVIPANVDVWVALQPHILAPDRTIRLLHAVARLRDGATFDSATMELNAYGKRVTAEFPAAYTGGQWTFSSVSFKDDVLKGARTPLYAIFALVILVLIIACGNVANLLLARGESRRRDIIIRSALGAGPARLAGELMAEALVLSSLGSVIGLALATTVPRIIYLLDRTALPRLGGVSTDWRVVLAMLCLILLSTLLFALFPMVERLRLRSSNTLIADRSNIRSLRSVKVGRVLVMVQTSLAVTVVVAAFFFADTFRHLQRVAVGFDAERVLTARVALFAPPPGTSAFQYYDSAIAAVERVPGVRRAAAVSHLPLSGAMLGSTFLAGDVSDPSRIDVDLRGITAGYFDAMGISVLQGRPFDRRDTAVTAPVVVVDETFARALSPSGDVLGRRVRWFRQPDTELEIVGVVAAVRHRSIDLPPEPTVYRPITQYARTSMFIIVKSAIDPRALVQQVAAAIGSVTPVQPVADVATMEERVGRAMARARTSVVLAAILAALAMLLSVVGVYGVLSFGVAQRRREFGVRLALGASPTSIRRMMLRYGLLLTAAGCAIGMFVAWTVVRAASSLLFQTSAADVGPYAIGATFVVVLTTVTLWIPARRAGRQDPTVALREE
jgi:predicted permease